MKINKIKTNVVKRKSCISISSNQGKSKKDNVEKPKILVKEVRLKNNGIPQQKKCVRDTLPSPLVPFLFNLYFKRLVAILVPAA